jgi:glucose/arabinose dehydrogenase
MRLPVLALALLAPCAVSAGTLTGAAAFGDWRSDAPGVTRLIRPDDVPPPAKPSVAPPAPAPRPADAKLSVPAGLAITEFAKLEGPRQVRVAPNGDIFVAETDAGRVTVIRAADGAAKPNLTSVFLDNLDRPFGIAFYPPGPHPRWVYVANNNSVVRVPYAEGQTKAAAAPEVVIKTLAETTGGHTTRDLAVSPDGKTLFVSVGSGSNIGDRMPAKPLVEAQAWQAEHGLGATWGTEAGRADILAFNPDGSGRRIFATGLRNCVSMAVQPRTGALWCVVNERDLIGDDLPPDYATGVRAGAFYGWPWYYIGAHEEPRRKGERPDLAGKVTTPDVLFQAHSAALGITFYNQGSGVSALGRDYVGDAFVALHGSWNRGKRTGYKLVRLKIKNGVPTGTYEDIVTGFVIDERKVWGRPVGVAVAHDGALLMTDDVSNTLWRIAPAK